MRQSIRRWRYAVPLAIVLVIATAGSALAAVEKIVGGKGYQDLGFGNGTYLVYTTNQRHKNSYWAVATGGSVTGERKMNARRTTAFTGNFDPGTDKVIFQQIKRNQSDIYTYDIATTTRTAVSRINTKKWEFSPRISNSFILYTVFHVRRGTQYDTIWLFNRSTGKKRKLAEYRRGNGRAFSFTTYVGQTWASWTVCTGKTCKVFVYQIATHNISKVPSKNKRPQFTGWIDEANGMLYFVRSAKACGRHVKLRRAALTGLGSASTLFSLPNGRTVGTGISLAPNPDGVTQDLLFSELRCTRRQPGDIYALRSVA